MQNNGQGIAIDLFLGVAIFLLLLTAVLAIWSNTETTASRELYEKEMQRMATEALDRLIRSKGDPENWEQPNAGNITAIGLAKADRVLDENKIKQLESGGIDRGLVAYYKFNEGEGTDVTDSSGNKNTGVLSGALWKTEADGCKSDGCLQFDGSNDYVTSTDIDYGLNNQITVMAWVKFSACSGDGGLCYIVSKSKWIGGTPYTLTVSYSKIMFMVNGFYQSTTDSYNDGMWHHCAGTIDGTTAKIYVDGSERISWQVTPATSNDHKVVIGSDDETPSFRPFNGAIDEVRVYKRALSASEIKALYDNPSGDVGASAFVKQKLLIGDNNYFLRVLSPTTPGATLGNYVRATAGVDPLLSLEPEKLMKTTLKRIVTYTFPLDADKPNEVAAPHPAIVELTLYRTRQ